MTASGFLKIAVLGAGASGFAPGVLQDALLIHKLDGIELAFVDPDEEVLYPLVEVGRRIATKVKSDAKITAHIHRAPALQGASFVLCAAAHERQARFAADCRIIDTFAPGHLVTEFGGIAGISYSLRQMRLIQDIATDMQAICAPGAMLLCASNPLPRVCQAAHEAGVPTVGFGCGSLSAYRSIWQILHDEPSDYPFEIPRGMLDLSMAGLNHLSFVLDLWDHDTGEDLYEALKEQVAKGRTASQPATAHLLLESGYFAAAGDDHLRAFLPPTPQSIPRRAAEEEQGDAERKRWLKSLLPIAEGKKPYEPLLATRTWERPIELIAALRFNRPASAFPCLNLVNARQLPQLPHEVFVETGATVDRTGIHPAEYILPESMLPLLRQ